MGAVKGCQGAVRLGIGGDGAAEGGAVELGVAGSAGWGCQAGPQWCPTSRGQLQDQHLPWLCVTVPGRNGSWKQGSAGACLLLAGVGIGSSAAGNRNTV